MNGLINVFLSYGLLLVIIVMIAGVGAAIGITARKRKNSKEDAVEKAGEATENAE